MSEADSEQRPPPSCEICERPVGGDYIITETYSDGELMDRGFYCRENCTPPGDESADIEDTGRARAEESQ